MSRVPTLGSTRRGARIAPPPGIFAAAGEAPRCSCPATGAAQHSNAPYHVSGEQEDEGGKKNGVVSTPGETSPSPQVLSLLTTPPVKRKEVN